MVVFVDYDRDASDDVQHHYSGTTLHSYVPPAKDTDVVAVEAFYTEKPRLGFVWDDNGNRQATGTHDDGLTSDNPNINAFSRCLSCYPVVTEIARYLDLNSLDALSKTCRQHRANLMPFCSQLAKRTLRCINESVEENGYQDSREIGRLTSGKIGKCARDMVGECRKCSTVICRNCTIKPPSAAMLKNRLRRLCASCCVAPYVYHLSPERGLPTAACARAFTYSAFARTPCQCEDMIWLCQTCGHSLRNNDTMYRRVWTWRTRYGAYLGAGLGTGIGEGCQGVKCGKGENCLAAQAIELEVDREVDESAITISHHHNHHYPDDDRANGHRALHGITFGEKSDGHQHNDEPGYLRQEIVGIGGVVKQKVKKRVVVGACVEEYEDERETGNYLRREETGQVRSWCGWCWRVVPSRKDLEQELA